MGPIINPGTLKAKNPPKTARKTIKGWIFMPSLSKKGLKILSLLEIKDSPQMTMKIAEP